MRDSYANLPAEMKAAPRWVVWRREPSKKKPGEFTKVPYQSKAPHRKAASTRAKEWSTFADALRAMQQHPELSGIGFVLGDGWVGVDCDHCHDPATGQTQEWASSVLTTLDSYSECSPSGDGIHVIVKGELPAGWRKRGNIEMYAADRFFTMTGHHVTGTPHTIERRTAALRIIHEQHAKPRITPSVTKTSTIPTTEDSAILERARRAKNGAKFRQLYDAGDFKGAGYPSPSEADLALANMLVHWADGDVNVADRLFRGSALMREKWDERHGERTYGAMTIAEAHRTYRPRLTGTAHCLPIVEPVSDEPLDIVCLADVEPEEISWLWPNRIALGKLTIIEGHPGVGKGMLSAELAACISTGRKLPDGTTMTPASVLFIGVEDANGDTVRPRLDAAGANARLVHSFSMVGDRLLTFPSGKALLRKAIEQTRAKLVIIDPITNHLDAGLSPNKDVEIRGALTPLAKLAEELAIAIVVVRHLVKAAAGSAITAGSGTMAFVGVVRCAMVCAKDPEDEDRRVLATVKNNLGKTPPSLSFRLEETANKRARIVWLGKSTHSADDLVAASRDDGERSRLTEAIDLLREWLSDGELTKKEIVERAKAANISPHGTLDRAAEKLKVERRKVGFGAQAHQVWRLRAPTHTTPVQMVSMEKNGAQSVEAEQRSILTNHGEPGGELVATLYQFPCTGNCGLTFSERGRTCFQCRQRGSAA